jgi:hypothetical protein
MKSNDLFINIFWWFELKLTANHFFNYSEPSLKHVRFHNIFQASNFKYCHNIFNIGTILKFSLIRTQMTRVTSAIYMDDGLRVSGKSSALVVLSIGHTNKAIRQIGYKDKSP